MSDLIHRQCDRPPPLSAVLEAARLSAVQTYLSSASVSSASAPGLYEGLVRRAAQLLPSPVAMLSLIGQDSQLVLASYGTDIRSIPRAMALCHHALDQPGGVLLIVDAPADARFCTHPLVAGPPRVRSCLAVTLVDADGYALGTLSVMDVAPMARGAASVPALRTLAAEAMALLTAQRATFKAPSGPNRPPPDRSGHFAGGVDPATPAWMGVRTEYTVTSGQGGRRLTSVAAGGPADRAGLCVGDVILSIDGRATRRRDDLTAAIARGPAARPLRLHVLRAGRAHDVPLWPEPMPARGVRR